MLLTKMMRKTSKWAILVSTKIGVCMGGACDYIRRATNPDFQEDDRAGFL